MLHATHGNAATQMDEFWGTLRWFENNPSQVSAHIVIAPDGAIAVVVPDNLRAHHDSENNSSWLGIEFAKRNPTRFNDKITDAQYRSAAWWLKKMAAKYGFPLDWVHLPEHRETTPGRRIGKIDIGPGFDKVRLMELL